MNTNNVCKIASYQEMILEGKSWKSSPSKEKKKILVVDDTQDIREVLSELIELEGHEVVIAKDGQKALEMIKNNIFTAVFLDLQMPRFSGLEVLDSLKKSGRIVLNKIIIITATSISSAELQKLKRDGVWIWMRKPFHYNELKSVLRNI